MNDITSIIGSWTNINNTIPHTGLEWFIKFLFLLALFKRSRHIPHQVSNYNTAIEVRNLDGVYLGGNINFLYSLLQGQHHYQDYTTDYTHDVI